MSQKYASGGVSLPTLLFIVFLILKLTGNIDWSWWWVTSPLWITFIVVIFTFLIIGILMLFIGRRTFRRLLK